MRIRQSVCYPMLKPAEMSIEEFFRGVAQIGFSAVELWFRDETFDEVAHTAARHRLVIASMCGHRDLGVGLNDPGQHERIEAELCASVEVAARVGIPGVICFSGNRRDGQTESDAVATAVLGLRRVVPHAEKHGVNLNLELLNSRYDHAGYQADRSAWGLAVCQQVRSSRVKLLYDIYHMQIMEGDVIRTLVEHIKWIGHFHTGGVPGRQDIDETQELNYGAICRAIAHTSYHLYVGHEFKPRYDVFASLRRAFAICDQ